MDPDVFVRASTTPGELGGGDGTEAHPFESVQAGIEALDGSGGIVGLFGGTHFIESVSLQDIHGQDKEHPIIVEPVKDSGKVFIDSCLPQFVEPNGGWVALHPPDGVEGEYIWPERFDHPAVVRHGAFFDRPKHTRLVSNDMVQDLRSTGQIWPRDAGENKVFVLDTRPGPTQGSYVPQFVKSRPKRRPWVYMGPGIWFDESAEEDEEDPSGVVVRYGGRHVHIRMAPTTNHISDEWPDYEGESNPNNLSLALSQELNYALFLRTCSHLTFKNLTLRFGSPDTVRLNNCLDVIFDHCRIRSASRAIFLIVDDKKDDHENRDIVVGNCEIDGGIPTWFFRSDRKDNYRFGPDSATQLTKEETTENRIGFSTSGVQISGEARSFNVEVHHCEIVNAHDSYIFGDGMKFHHNWVNNLNDDGIAVSFDGGTKNAHIYSNVMTQCLTALSFAAKRVGMVKIYANLFDIREPTLGVRPPTDVGVPDALRQGHFFKDGADEGAIELFHNTCVVRDPGAKGDDFGDANDAGFSYYASIGAGEHPRRAFNNIFVAAYTPDAVRPIAFLAPRSFACETNGNTFFRVPEGDGLNHFLVRRTKALDSELNEGRSFADLDAYHEQYWPGGDVNEYEHDSLLHDPQFRSFDTVTGDRHPGDDLRLQPRPDDFDPATQPWRVAVTMPDPLGELYEEATTTHSEDRGCYPSNGARLAVGVDSRKKFPRRRRPHLGPETHPPINDPPVVDGRLRQRRIVPTDEEDSTILWSVGYSENRVSSAESELEASIPVPWPSDQYVTVDEQVLGIVGVVAADWPTVDAGGLVFGGAISVSWFNRADLQATVDRLRSDADQLGRPLRIGDSFWVRGYSPSSLDAWDDLRDITIHARAMAKMAVAAVAVGAIDYEPYFESDRDIIDESDASDAAQTSRRDEPRPSGPATASPVL